MKPTFNLKNIQIKTIKAFKWKKSRVKSNLSSGLNLKDFNISKQLKLQMNVCTTSHYWFLGNSSKHMNTPTNPSYR